MCHRTPQIAHHLVWVNANLKDVVGESEERSQRKGSHKDCNETKLDDWKKISEKKLHLFAGLIKCFFAGSINPIYLTLLLFNDQNEYKVIENGHSLVNQICIYIGRDLLIETTVIRI